MKKPDFLLIATIACFICGATLLTISLIFRRDYLLYSIIPLGLSSILAIVGGSKKKWHRKKD